MDLRQLLRTLRRERIPALLAFLAVVGLSVALAGPSRDDYQSSATLFVQPASTSSGGSASVQAVQFLMPALEARVASTSMDADVRSGLGDALALASWSAIGVSDPGTGLLELRVISSDPSVPLPVAEAYTADLQAYVESSDIAVEVSVLDPASPAVGLTNRRLLSLGLSGAVLGLGAALVAALVAARIRRPRRLADDVRERYGIPVLGEIPKVGRRVDLQPSSLYISNDQRTVEAFMGVRTSVEVQLAARGLRSLAVVSRGAGEGKTTVAAHLGWTLASLGHRVLLSDCDLRHAYLDGVVNSGAGLSLAESTPLAGMLPVEGTSLSQLFYLSASGLRLAVINKIGRRAPHPAEVVTSGMSMVDGAARKADALLIVDSPPIMGAAEGRYIVSVVDAVVVVVDARRPLALEDLEETLRLLREAGATPLGVVLNRAKLSRARQREEQLYYIDRSQWGAVAQHTEAAAAEVAARAAVDSKGEQPHDLSDGETTPPAPVAADAPAAAAAVPTEDGQLDPTGGRGDTAPRRADGAQHDDTLAGDPLLSPGPPVVAAGPDAAAAESESESAPGWAGDETPLFQSVNGRTHEQERSGVPATGWPV